MTSTTVKDVNPHYSYAAGKPQGREGSLTESFTDAMGKAASANVAVSKSKGSETLVNTKKASSVKKDMPKTNDTEQQTVHKEQELDKTSDKDVKKSEEPKDVVSDAAKSEKADKFEDEEQKEITSKAEEILSAMADLLGVSKEEILSTLAALGLTVEALLAAENMAQIVMGVTGAEGDMALLTDETLYAHVKELMQMAEDGRAELLDSLGITEEELNSILKAMKEMPESGKVPANEVAGGSMETDENAAQSETMPDAEIMDGTEMTTVSQKENQADVTNKAQTENPSAEVTAQSQEESGKTEVKQPTIEVDHQTTETEKPVEVKEESSNQGKESGHFGNQSETGNSFMQTFTGQLTGNNVGQAQNAEVPFTMLMPDTQEIMRQVMDYMKITVTPEMSEIHMQLNPESLGSIGVHIAAKDGALTAQFTAQNEAVKAALETQIVQLRETLNEQGVKVEAVEVTIASHEFERNLQQDQGQQEQADKEKQSGRRIRSINLNDLEGLEAEQLEEEDLLRVHMMKMNGSTIDFEA